MWQPVFMISGYILGILGLIMFIPAGFDIIETNASWSPFISAAICTMFFGFSLFLSNYTKIEKISLKQGYLVTTVSWLMACVFASLPFLFMGTTDSFANALFEATSGLTGTGVSFIHDVEASPKSVLMWRSLLNFVGGIGVVIFVVALLPFLGIGGMQIFQRENSDSNDKFMPKFSYIAKRLIFVYTLLVVLCSGALLLCGLNAFDAVNNAMGAIGTGGFSTKNSSIGGFNNPMAEWVLALFMLLASLPLTFYILLVRQLPADKNSQVRVFLKTVFYLGIFITIYLYATSEYSFATALRYSYFTLISVVTTTGFSVCNFPEWGGWATAVFLLLSLMGGCTGSTSGSIKVFRWQTIYVFLRKYFLSAIEPHRVIPMKIAKVNMSEKVTMSVFVYVFSFLISLFVLSLLISLCGIDFQTSLAAVVCCITNVGVGTVDVIGPQGNFDFFSDTVKYILSFSMFLGRLEVITVLVIFTRSFWRN